MSPANPQNSNLHLDGPDRPTPDPVDPAVVVPSPPQTDRVTDQDGTHNNQAYALPTFPVVQEPNFMWAEVEGSTFAGRINLVYAEIIHWRHNLFKVPSGRTGKAFVAELSRLLRAYAEGSTLESIALKCVMSMPALLLQKPHKSSKVKEHIACMERRLKLWAAGDLDGLISEGRTIQNRLVTAPHGPSSEERLAQSFAKLMFHGKIKSAMRLLTNNGRGSKLNLNDRVSGSKTVHEVLLEKHPAGEPLIPSAVATHEVPIVAPHPIIYQQIDGPMIHATALKTAGAAGPSGIDAAGWKRMLSSFQRESTELCEAVAALARRMSSQYVDPSGLTALTACRLVALDKQPGVRPIGIGEVLGRIVGKATLAVVGPDVQQVAGALQVCTGQQGGCESAVHAMRLTFEDPVTEAILLVDATNAFNSLNREVALQNVIHVCPSIAPAIVNTYRSHSHLCVDGEILYSQEGTTQGDPLAMAMYAIATLPLIHRLAESCSTRQVWFADDATAGGQLPQLKCWWDQLRRIGPDYGYHANAAKSWLIVKEEHLDQAVTIFGSSGVQITKEGQRHLGAALGTRTFVEAFVTERVKEWTREVEHLATIAASQPHAAYSALTHGLTSKWSYLSRTVPNISDLFMPLENAIRHQLLPALTGRSGLTDLERDLLALPTRHGGLGISNPTKSANQQFNHSQRVTAPLTALILQQERSYPRSVASEQGSLKGRIKAELRHAWAEEATRLRARLPTDLQHVMDCSSEKGASNWLNVLPLSELGFSLHKGAFRDAVCLRYGWKPPYMQSKCTCGKQFTVEHAFSCMQGGFPALRHNDIRDITARYLSEVCPNVEVEPELQPLSGERLHFRTSNVEDGARLDVRAQGFWGDKHRGAFFDVKVFNPYAPSNCKSSLSSVYKRHENEKRRGYQQRVTEVEHSSFTPLVFSAIGGMGPAATTMYRRLASLLADKRSLPYHQVIGQLRCLLNFSLLRSAIMCIRGTRSAQNRPVRQERDDPLDRPV